MVQLVRGSFVFGLYLLPFHRLLVVDYRTEFYIHERSTAGVWTGLQRAMLANH